MAVVMTENKEALSELQVQDRLSVLVFSLEPALYFKALRNRPIPERRAL
jgi:hypothetical protein